MLPTIIDSAWRELASASPDSDQIARLAVACRNELLKKTIVIYPAGQLGRTLAATLEAHGVPVALYVDRAAADIRHIGGVTVLEPECLRELTESHVVLVSANLDAMMQQFVGIVRDHHPSMTILNGFKLNRLLCYSACLQKLADGASCDIFGCERCGFERHDCSIAARYLQRVARHQPLADDWRSPSSTWFGYIVGQICTLKCIHCCEAVPFLRDRTFVPREVIINDVRKMAEASRFVTFVELIGGEPFLHPEFQSIVEELLGIPNIGYVKSFTNGTVVPSVSLCRILKNPRFMLQVSNYEQQADGRLLDNIHKTRAILKEQDVPYIFTRHLEWQDFTSFDLHHADDMKLPAVFNACMLRNCNRLYRGTLYRCPHQYAGIELGVLERRAIECVDINARDSQGLAKAIEDFENVPFIDACRHCLMPFDAPTVAAGIQLRRRTTRERVGAAE